MSSLSRIKTIALISAISSTCQGIAWSVMSLLAILTYSCTIKPPEVKKVEDLSYIHYFAAYYQGDCDADLDFYKDTKLMTNPEKLLILNIFLYIINLLLSIAAITLIFAVASSKKRFIFGWMVFYVIIGFCASFADVVATSVAASDYSAISNTVLVYNRGMAGLSLLVILLILSKGVLLWLANMAFSSVLAVSICSKSFHKTESESNLRLHDLYFGNPKEVNNISESTSSFHFDRMKKPVIYVDRPAVLGDTHKEFPEHSAFSRWPRLHPENRFKTFSSSEVPPPPTSTTPHIPMPSIQSVNQGDRQGREGSLQEAILTVRPLRSIRPKIPIDNQKY